MLRICSLLRIISVDIKVLRGKNQIGGNIIEVSNVNTRIILDAGYELNENDVQTIPPINGLFDSAGYDAVFISHYHLDHMGLAESIHPEIPVYMGDKALDIVRASLRYKNEPIEDRYKPFSAGTKLVIGSMEITPLLADHSAFDSYMFLLESGGEKVLYTGDFRANGRKSFAVLLSSLPKKVDTLICEGTTLSRQDKKT